MGSPSKPCEVLEAWKANSLAEEHPGKNQRRWGGRQASGLTCAIDVEGLKHRPPSKGGGLCHEFRSL